MTIKEIEDEIADNKKTDKELRKKWDDLGWKIMDMQDEYEAMRKEIERLDSQKPQDKVI